jgi:carbon monoxide dehydrogenase subunit G
MAHGSIGCSRIGAHNMRIEGEYVFHGPRKAVWELVRDPNVLAAALPGTQSMEQVSKSEYKGRMNVRIGPMAGLFSGRVVVSDEVPPESCTLAVEGRGGPGWVKGTGGMHLTEQGADTTLMKYEGDLQIGGRLASVGQRLMDSVSKSIIRQGLDSMDKLLQARLAPELEVAGVAEAVSTTAEVPKPKPEPPAFRPPSEVEFAAGVARDVVKDVAADLFAPEYRTAWMAAIVAIVAMAIGFWLGRKCRTN